MCRVGLAWYLLLSSTSGLYPAPARGEDWFMLLVTDDLFILPRYRGEVRNCSAGFWYIACLCWNAFPSVRMIFAVAPFHVLRNTWCSSEWDTKIMCSREGRKLEVMGIAEDGPWGSDKKKVAGEWVETHRTRIHTMRADFFQLRCAFAEGLLGFSLLNKTVACSRL